MVCFVPVYHHLPIDRVNGTIKNYLSYIEQQFLGQPWMIDVIYSRPMHSILSFYFTVVRKHLSYDKNWNTSVEGWVIEVPWHLNMQSVSSLMQRTERIWGLTMKQIVWMVNKDTANGNVFLCSDFFILSQHTCISVIGFQFLC